MNIEYYVKATGRCPVKDFIKKLPQTARVRVVRRISMLQELGHTLRRPHVDTLRDGIRELRIPTYHGSYRILFSIVEKDTSVLLLGITKKSGKVADSYIKQAIEYTEDYRTRCMRK